MTIPPLMLWAIIPVGIALAFDAKFMAFVIAVVAVLLCTTTLLAVVASFATVAGLFLTTYGVELLLVLGCIWFVTRKEMK